MKREQRVPALIECVITCLELAQELEPGDVELEAFALEIIPRMQTYLATRKLGEEEAD